MGRKGRATMVTKSTRGRGKGASTAQASGSNAAADDVTSTATRGRRGRGRAVPTVNTNTRRRTRQAVKAGQNTSPVEDRTNDPEVLARRARTTTSGTKDPATKRNVTTATSKTAPASKSPVQVGGEQSAARRHEDIPETADEQPKASLVTEQPQMIETGAKSQLLSPVTGIKRALPDGGADQNGESKRQKLDDEQKTTAITSAPVETSTESLSEEVAVNVDNKFQDGRSTSEQEPELRNQSANSPPASSLLTPPEFRRVPTPPSGSLPRPTASPEQDEQDSTAKAPDDADLPGPIWPVASTGDTEVDLGLTLQSEQNTTESETETDDAAGTDNPAVAERSQEIQLPRPVAQEATQPVDQTFPGLRNLPKSEVQSSAQVADTPTIRDKDAVQDLDNDLFGEEEDKVEPQVLTGLPLPPPTLPPASTRNATPPSTPGKIISPTGLHLPATPGPTKTTFFGNGNGNGSTPFTAEKIHHPTYDAPSGPRAQNMSIIADEVGGEDEEEMLPPADSTDEPREVDNLVAAVSQVSDGDEAEDGEEWRVVDGQKEAGEETRESGGGKRSALIDVMTGRRVGEDAGRKDGSLTVKEDLDDLYE